MKKIIPLVLVLVVIGLASYFYTASQGSDGGHAIAQAVPADTLVYVGMTGDNGLAQYTRAMQKTAVESVVRDSAELQKSAKDFGQAGLFLSGLFQGYAHRVKQGKSIPGLGKTPHWAFYTVGIMPVMRIQLADADAFRKFLDQAAQQGGAHAQSASYEGVDYRSYSIAYEGDKKDATLLVAVQPQFAVITLDTKAFRDDTLPVALGLKAPKQSIAGSGKLKEVAQNNGFEQGFLAFIDQQKIVAALTGAQGSLAGEMLGKLDRDAHSLKKLRIPACRDDLQTMAKGWPISAAGLLSLNKVDDGAVRISERFVSRLTDSSLTSTLASLRGHIPAGLLSGKRKPVAGVAVALDTDELIPVLSKLQKRFVQADFHCDWLVKAQDRVKQKDPATSAGIATTMVKGIKGVSFSLLDLDASPGDAPFAADALLTISTKNPESLVKMASMMGPKILKGIQVPSDGGSVQVVPSLHGLPAVRAMISGKHLVVYTGSKAAKVAKSLKKDKLKPNGMIFYRVDYTKLSQLVNAVAPILKKRGDAEAVESIQQTFRELASMKLRLQVAQDVTKQGFTIDTKAHAVLPQSQAN